MSKFSKLATVTVLSAGLVLGACSKQTFDLGGRGSPAAQDATSTFFVGGIGQQHKINAAQIFGGKQNAAKVEAEQTFLNGILSAITGGIYSPRQYRVVCTC